jgi:uncharacterized repeat protein (TIGR03803 family)
MRAPTLASVRVSDFFASAIAVMALIFAATLNSPAQTESVIYNLVSEPFSGLATDTAGNLYGISQHGGSGGNGFVFELSQVGGAWQSTVLYNFTGGNDGGAPLAQPVIDAAGNVYGTTSVGGAHKYGVVYELTPLAGGWQPKGRGKILPSMNSQATLTAVFRGP